MSESHLVWPDSQIEPFMHYLRIECGLAANTIISYRRDLKKFDRYCRQNGLDAVDRISPLVVQEYARFLAEDKLSTASIARHLVSVRMFMRFHLLENLTTKDVCAALETPKTWQRVPRVLNKQSTLSLVESIDPASPMALRDRALLELLYATGMRASEVAGLKLEDVNFQIRFIRCFGKGNKERIIPFYELAQSVLEQYLRELRPKLTIKRDPGTLFVSRTGRALDRIEVWRIVKKAAAVAGLIGKVTPHTLRHCFGSHLLQGGADLRTVQEMLGHADVTTTQIYTHVDQEYLRAIHKKFHPRP